MSGLRVDGRRLWARLAEPLFSRCGICNFPRSRLSTLISQLLTSLLVLCSITVHAQDSPPRLFAELAATSPPVRIGEAMPTIWDIQKFQPGIMEGRFEFRVHLGTVEFYQYTTDEVVLHESEHRFRYLFPPIVTNIVSGEIEVDVTWHDKSGEQIPLRMQLIRVPSTALRTLMIGVIEERSFQGRRRDWDARLQQLPLETLGEPQGQVLGDSLGRRAALQTVFVNWDAANVPTDPLSFTPYEIIAVAGNVFATLRRPQLDALLAWCQAGGSLYLEPEGLLEPYHLEFLNRLTEQRPDHLPWTMNASGRIEWPADAADFAGALVYCDLGRAAVVNSARGEDLNLRRVTQFLWNWSSALNPYEFAARGLSPASNRMYGVHRPPHVVELLYQGLEQTLMPPSVRLVPLWLIMTLLIGLILLIGPVDWWVLGWLRLRRFTWLTWPFWTVVFALLTVGLSNWYLQSTDVPRVLQMHDIGRDGHIVRTQTFTLIFPSQSRVETQSIERGLWQPLAGLAASQDGTPIPTGTNAAFMVETERPTVRISPKIAGRVPTRYTAEQPVGQWSRQISYCLQMPNPADEPETPIDWTAIDATEWWDAQTFPAKIVEDLTERLGTTPLVQRFAPRINSAAVNLAADMPRSAGPLDKHRKILSSVTWPPELSGTMSLGSMWSTSPLRHVYLHATLAGIPALLVAVQTDDTITVYRRLAPIPPLHTTRFSKPVAP